MNFCFIFNKTSGKASDNLSYHTGKLRYHKESNGVYGNGVYFLH